LAEELNNASGASRREGANVCLEFEQATRSNTPSFRDAPLGAGPESILPVVVMDSGLVILALRNDGSQLGYSLKIASEISAPTIRDSDHLVALAGERSKPKASDEGLSASPGVWKVRSAPVRQERTSRRLCNPEDRDARAPVWLTSSSGLVENLRSLAAESFKFEAY
jgi:hypothetical protein